MTAARHEFHKATRTFTGADAETWAVLIDTETSELRVEHRYERRRFGTKAEAWTVYGVEEFLATADGKWLRVELNAALSKIVGAGHETGKALSD